MRLCLAIVRQSAVVEEKVVQVHLVVPVGDAGIRCWSTMHLGLTDFRFDFWCYVSAVFVIAGGDHHVRVPRLQPEPDALSVVRVGL